MKHRYSLIITAVMALAALTATAETRQQLASYAASLKGKKKAELKTAMYQLMQPKKVLGYGSGSSKTWSGFYKTDRIVATNECRNRYSTDKFYFSNGNTNSAISGMNIEHSFPKSWWGGHENNAYKDLYNLYPSESSANSKKSNYVMGEVTNPSILDDYEKVGTGSQGSVKMVEPHDEWKGDFSRSYYYMVTTYQNFTWTSEGLNCLENNTWPTLQSWAYNLYLKWTRTDKVDSIEVARNNAVYAIQGNRNLFIDYPYLAEYVWGDSTDVAFDPTTSVTTASDDDRYGKISQTDNPTNPDNPDVDPTYDGWIFAKITGQPTDGKRYLIVVNNSGSLLAMKTISSGKTYEYLNADAVTATDSSNDTIKLTSDADAFTFEETDGGFLFLGSDNKYYYNDKTNDSYRTFNAAASVPSGNVWTFSSRSNGTYTISNGEKFIQYSTKYSSFGAYTSAQSKALYPFLYEEQDNTPTAIETITVPERRYDDGAVYTIQGMRVSGDGQLPPGIYIRGGRKFIVR